MWAPNVLGRARYNEDKLGDAISQGISQYVIVGAGLNVLADGLFLTQRRRIAELAIKGRLPTMSGDTGFAEAGGLMNYGPSITDGVRSAATYVDKILKGAKPTDLPVEQPTKFELVINLKTAKALGLTISPSVLARADEVIQ